jgi:hypothetical protein
MEVMKHNAIYRSNTFEYNNKNNQKTSGEIQKNILPIVG